MRCSGPPSKGEGVNLPTQPPHYNGERFCSVCGRPLKKVFLDTFNPMNGKREYDFACSKKLGFFKMEKHDYYIVSK